jgi:hypothetical protein
MGQTTSGVFIDIKVASKFKYEAVSTVCEREKALRTSSLYFSKNNW